MNLGQEQPSRFGEKLTDAACKVAILAHPAEEAVCEIWTEGLLVNAPSSAPVFLKFTEMKFEPINFGVNIKTPSGTITLTGLGANFEPFLRRLTDSWGDALAASLLMSERVIYQARATYINVRADGSQSFGACRARIQPTSLVILPADSLPVRLPFSKVTSAEKGSFRVTVTTPDMGTFELLRMGAALDYFADQLAAARRDYEGQSYQMLVGLSPGVGFDHLLKLATLMAEGRAITKKEAIRQSFDFWLTLERKVIESPSGPSYSHLRSLAVDELTSIGLRRTFRDDSYWFMMAIAGSADRGGNSVVMEFTSESGHATYLFRVMGRGEFPGSSSEQFQAAAIKSMNAINEALITTRFRREPIYLDESRLNTEPYSRHLYAAKNLPELKFLRDRFYARIVHSTPESWAQDLADALLFNVQTPDDLLKWDRSQLDPQNAPG